MGKLLATSFYPRQGSCSLGHFLSSIYLSLLLSRLIGPDHWRMFTERDLNERESSYYTAENFQHPCESAHPKSNRAELVLTRTHRGQPID